MPCPSLAIPTAADILRAIDWTIKNRVSAAYGQVCSINLSLGGSDFYTSPCAGDVYQAVFAEARGAGILVAVAAGNEGKRGSLSSPSCAPAAVSVGAVYDSGFGTALWGGSAACSDDTTAADLVTCFSNSATYLTVLAPGAMIKAGGVSYGGTSQATPHVAAAIAVLKASAPAATPDQIVAALRDGGKPVRDSRNALTTPRLDLDSSTQLLAARTGDKTPPADVAVKINGGAAYTGSPHVTLAISAIDPSGVAQACISNDVAVTDCSNYQDFLSALPWTLAPGDDGPRSVLVWLKDFKGNTMAAPARADVILDTQPPSGAAIVISGGSAATASRTVMLSLAGADAGGGPLHMCLSNSGNAMACMPYAAFTATKPWTLAAGGDGDRKVHLFLRDRAQNVARASATIRLDTQPPTGCEVKLAGSAGHSGVTGSLQVTLSVSASDAGQISRMCIANSDAKMLDKGGCSAWQPFAAQQHWMLADGADGSRSVAVLLSDEAGNIMRAAAAGTIVLDTQPPAAARLVVNHGMPTVWTNNLALEVSGTDLTGITDMCVTDNPAAATPGAACPAGFEPFVASRAWQLALGGDGPHKVRVWLSDGLGHVTPAPAEATFVLDTLSATRAITINAGARFTASKAVNVSVAVPARGVDASGSLLVCISETATTPADCKGSDWQPYGKVRAFVLKSSSQGVRRLRAFLRDAQANVSAGGAETTIVYDSMPPTTNVKALNFSAAAISRNAATLAFNASATVDAVSGVTTFLVGMSFVAGALLLQLLPDEAAAFGCFAAVVRDVLPGYYAPTMTALQVDQELFRHLVREHHPRLAAHLDELGVDPGGPLPGWLLSGFVNCLPFESALRVWDVAFLERSPAPLMRVCLAMVEIYGAALLGSADVLDAGQLLHAMPSMTFDASRLIAVADRAFGDITNNNLQALQHCFRAELQQKRETQQAVDAQRRKAALERTGSAAAMAAVHSTGSLSVAAVAAAADAAAQGLPEAVSEAQRRANAVAPAPALPAVAGSVAAGEVEQGEEDQSEDEEGLEEGEDADEDERVHVQAQVQVQRPSLKGGKGACGEEQRRFEHEEEQGEGAEEGDGRSPRQLQGSQQGAQGGGPASPRSSRSSPVPSAFAAVNSRKKEQQQQQQQQPACTGNVDTGASSRWAEFKEHSTHFGGSAEDAADAVAGAAQASAAIATPVAAPAAAALRPAAAARAGAASVPSEDPELYNEASDDFEESEGVNLLLVPQSQPAAPGCGRPGALAVACSGGAGCGSPGGGGDGGGSGGGVSAHRYRILDKPTARRGCLAAAYDIAASPGLLPPTRTPLTSAPVGGAGDAKGEPIPGANPGRRPQRQRSDGSAAAAAGAGVDPVSSGSFDSGVWQLARRSSTLRSGEEEWVDVVPSSSPGGWMAAAVGPHARPGGGGGGGGPGGRHAGAVVGRQPGPV
ncbi:hypothetical protein MNEG_4786, partial [Monoraphidium neglectum]